MAGRAGGATSLIKTNEQNLSSLSILQSRETLGSKNVTKHFVREKKEKVQKEQGQRGNIFRNNRAIKADPSCQISLKSVLPMPYKNRFAKTPSFFQSPSRHHMQLLTRDERIQI